MEDDLPFEVTWRDTPTTDDEKRGNEMYNNCDDNDPVEDVGDDGQCHHEQFGELLHAILSVCQKRPRMWL